MKNKEYVSLISLKSIWYVLNNDIIHLKEDIQKIIDSEKVED